MQAAIAALLDGSKPGAPGGAPGMTGAPRMQPPPPMIGAPPPLDTNAEAPAYDVSKDPGWAHMVDPNNHPLRALLSGLSPEERELLRAWKMGVQAPATTSQAPGTI